MLDIKFVRENPDVVKENIRKKFQDQKIPMVDEVIALDQENRNIKQEVESLRANKNKISKQIGALMAQGKKEEAEEVRSEKLCARYSPCGHGLPRNSHKPRGLHRPDESKGLWCGLARQP